MARVRKFNEPGTKEDRIRWNKAGTRKWLTVYTVMEYHPEAKAKASEPEEKPKASKAKSKKPKASKAKPTAKAKKAKSSKPKSKAKPRKAKSSKPKS